MREQVTFAVDANGCAHYVEVSAAMKRQLSIEDIGALIDEWPGDLPKNLAPGFYAAMLDVSGDLDNPDLKWDQVEKLQARPSFTNVTKLPPHKEKEPRVRNKKSPKQEAGEMGVRVRRKGELI